MVLAYLRTCTKRMLFAFRKKNFCAHLLLSFRYDARSSLYTTLSDEVEQTLSCERLVGRLFVPAQTKSHRHSGSHSMTVEPSALGCGHGLQVCGERCASIRLVVDC